MSSTVRSFGQFDRSANPRGRHRHRKIGHAERTQRVERVTGYMVTYRHRGDIHRARMSKRPGDTIRVRIDVTPA